MAIPWIDFTEEGLNLEEGSEGWKRMSKKVKEACESDGWFVLVYNKITREAREGMIEEMKALFDLPQETKHKYVSPKAYRSYHGTCPVIPLVESFGLDDAHLQDTAQAFTTLMWPQGNPNFCERLKEMSRELVELNAMLVKMIVEGVLGGGGENWNEAAEKLGSTSNMRLMKYRVPGKEDSDAALVPHTDKSTLTILTQNDVHGLQFLTKDGQWVQPTLPPNAFTVIVGDVLKAWSNGILHAVSHRVIMGGPKVRYSLGVFVMPNDDTKVEVPPQLLDQAHPLRYRPFTYGHYFDFYTSSPRDNALELFAAL